MLYGYRQSNFKNFERKNFSISKIYYYSGHTWRLMFLLNSNTIYNSLIKKFYNSSTTIPFIFVGFEVFIYSGLKWLSRFVSRWSVGFKLGSLTWNRKLAIYKSKQIKKK